MQRSTPGPEPIATRLDPNTCQIECQTECQIECQTECQNICQRECQKDCQIECQNICQNRCQIECQKECQTRCQIECQIEYQNMYQKECQTACQSICQKECQIESQNIHMYIYIYIYSIYTSRWYVRNYVRIVCQGGDHSKKVSFFLPWARSLPCRWSAMASSSWLLRRWKLSLKCGQHSTVADIASLILSGKKEACLSSKCDRDIDIFGYPGISLDLLFVRKKTRIRRNMDGQSRQGCNIVSPVRKAMTRPPE